MRATEDHAPSSYDLVRLPLQSADEYAAAPAHAVAEEWSYELAQDVADDGPLAAAWRARTRDTDWEATVGRRRGAEQRAAVLRPARVLALPPVLAFAPLDPTDPLALGLAPDDTALADAYSEGYRDGQAIAAHDYARAAA